MRKNRRNKRSEKKWKEKKRKKERFWFEYVTLSALENCGNLSIYESNNCKI